MFPGKRRAAGSAPVDAPTSPLPASETLLLVLLLLWCKSATPAGVSVEARDGPLGVSACALKLQSAKQNAARMIVDMFWHKSRSFGARARAQFLWPTWPRAESTFSRDARVSCEYFKDRTVQL